LSTQLTASEFSGLIGVTEPRRVAGTNSSKE
jgi:hypothetical protein